MSDDRPAPSGRASPSVGSPPHAGAARSVPRSGRRDRDLCAHDRLAVAVPLRPQLPHRRRADRHRGARRDRHDDDHRERRHRSVGRIGDRADGRRHGARAPRRLAPLLAVLAGVLAGGIVGVVNGLAITRLRVIPFIATLGMLGIARGVAKWIADQQTVNVPETWVNDLAVTFPRPELADRRPGRVAGAAARDRGGPGPPAHGVRAPRVRDRVERSGRARVRHPGGPDEGRGSTVSRACCSDSPA